MASVMKGLNKCSIFKLHNLLTDFNVSTGYALYILLVIVYCSYLINDS